MTDERPELRRDGDLVWVPAAAAPPGVRGGVSTRLGGVSEGHLAALNLGTRTGDSEAHLEANLSRLAAATGVRIDQSARIRLTHGTRLVEATGPGLTAEADGLWTRLGGLPLALTVADCLPLLLAADAGPVALVHCGWRGLAAGIVAQTLSRLCAEAGRPAGSWWAWIGPGIGPCCFAVDEEVAARFPPSARRRTEPGARLSVDLPGYLRGELLAAGLAPDRVRAAGLCTSCEASLFYSHRRDRGATGRMLAWIERAV